MGIRECGDWLWFWRRPTASPERVERLRDRRLRRLVRHAYEKVPYYRRLLEDAGVGPEEIRGVADLHRIPVSTKLGFVSRPLEERLARGTDRARCVTHLTSGSTGVPAEILRTPLEEYSLQLHRIRKFRIQGLRPGYRMVSILFAPKKNPSRLLRALGLTAYAQLDCFREPGDLLRELRRLQPHVLAGYPHVLVRLAAAATEADREKLRPRLILSGGETLSHGARRAVSETFGCPVRDSYGAHECNLVAWECTCCGLFHTADDSVIVEVLRDGSPSGPGEEGTVVVTNLYSLAMPILRFDLGDLARRPATRPPCRIRFGAIERVLGRAGSEIVLEDGRRVTSMMVEAALEVVPGLAWHQVVLTGDGAARVRYEALPGAEPGLEARVVEACRPLLSPDFALAAERCDAPLLTKAGKLVFHRLVTEG